MAPCANSTRSGAVSQPGHRGFTRASSPLATIPAISGSNSYERIRHHAHRCGPSARRTPGAESTARPAARSNRTSRRHCRPCGPATSTTSAPPSGCAIRSSSARGARRPTATRRRTGGPRHRLVRRFREHLIVRTVPGHDEPGEVVGTYRGAHPGRGPRAGSFYSDTEPDPLAPASVARPAWWSLAAAACTLTIAWAPSTLPCGARWRNSWNTTPWGR